MFVENVADVGEPWVVGYWKADSVHFGLANLHQGSFSRNFPDFLESSRDYFWPVAAHDEFLFEDSQVVGDRLRSLGSEQILRRRYANENGMFLAMKLGCELVGAKYVHFVPGLMYKLVLI